MCYTQSLTLSVLCIVVNQFRRQLRILKKIAEKTGPVAPLEKKHASSQVNPYILFSFSDYLFSHDLISFISSLTDRVICIVSLVVYVHWHNQSLIYNHLVLNTNFFEPHVSLIYIMYFNIWNWKNVSLHLFCSMDIGLYEDQLQIA